MPKTYEEINQRIREGKAVVVTAEEVIPLVQEKGPRRVAEEVDVVTTATFAPMCSSGAFLNFGHSDPPIRMQSVRLNGVPAHAGVAAVDAYLGATECSQDRGPAYGGAHVIEDLISGREVLLEAESPGTDCYPRRSVRTTVKLDHLNQAYLYNPRNCYQNYAAATNGSDHMIYTYMGKLLPRCANVTYCSAGQLSPLLNDPDLRTVGIGTRVFLGGGTGFVAGEGTQNLSTRRRRNGVPVGPGATLALTGDLRSMHPRYLRAAVFPHYGVTVFVGVGIAIPILDEDMAARVGIRDQDIYTVVLDYGYPHRDRPALAEVNYAQLRSGSIELNGRRVPTAPLSSLARAREIAAVLKEWVSRGRFLLTQPVAPLPLRTAVNTLSEDTLSEDTGSPVGHDGRPAPALDAPVVSHHQVAPTMDAAARPTLDASRCVACGACTAVCLAGALRIGPPTWELAFEPERCTACGLCLDACPVGAISVAGIRTGGGNGHHEPAVSACVRGGLTCR